MNHEWARQFCRAMRKNIARQERLDLWLVVPQSNLLYGEGMRNTLTTLRARWVSTAKLDLRSDGNRRVYNTAYDRYYAALGRRLGYKRDKYTGFYIDTEGRMPGINDMEERLG